MITLLNKNKEKAVWGIFSKSLFFRAELSVTAIFKKTESGDGKKEHV